MPPPKAAAPRAAAAPAGDAPVLDIRTPSEGDAATGGGPHLAQRPRSRPADPPPAEAPEAAAAPAPPEPVPSQPATATGVVDRPFTLDDVILAWSTTLAGLNPPVRAAIQDAQPIAVEGILITFGVRAVRLEAINKRFRQEADAIKTALASGLGQMPKFRLVRHDFDAPDAFAPPSEGGAAAQPAPPPDPTDEGEIDIRELENAPPSDAPLDSQARLIETFGAQVVEERPRT
jgi:hypothetical protein